MITRIARIGSKALQKLEPEERAQLLRNIAQSLKHNQSELIIANNVDLEKAKNGSKYSSRFFHLVLQILTKQISL